MFHLDMAHLVSTIGFIGVLCVVFLEMGFFFGFFLPGDSLVFTTGLLASKGLFNIWVLIPSLILTAIMGYIVGYWFGHRLGGWLNQRPDSFFFRRRYLTVAKTFIHQHGGKSIVLGRLVPIVRTFAPIVAGMSSMSYSRYTICNVLGALLWGGGVTLVGYWAGGLIPNATHWILPLAGLIILITLAPGIIHLIKQLKRKLQGRFRLTCCSKRKLD